MTSPTPRPWHIDGREIMGADGSTVAIWSGEGIAPFQLETFPREEANAQLIVTACNAAARPEPPVEGALEEAFDEDMFREGMRAAGATEEEIRVATPAFKSGRLAGLNEAAAARSGVV